jgi:putative nucleotidyltransferase with HDIG domain
MSFDPTVEEQELLADTFRRVSSPMTARELLAELLVGASFVTAVVALWWVHPPHGVPLLPTVLCVIVLALATLVRIDTPLGFTVPTQLAFVPLLFAVPVALVPIAVMVALAIARVPDVVRRDVRPSKLLRTPGNAWFAIGPVAVFAIAGVEPRDATAGLLLVALLSQFGVDFVVSAVRFGIAWRATLASQLRETWVYAIDAALSGVALVVAEDVHSAPGAVVALVPLLGLLAIFAHERHHRLEGLLELNNAYRGTALVLGNVVEADDGYTGEHCKGVVELAIAVGQHLGLSAAALRNLEFAALLHDVGKISIPKEIINKPGKLDPQEWAIVKTHTIEGQKMLNRVGGFMREVGLIVRSHHERWDGGGYPDGLAGEAIPLEARIISCCDTWNAMRTDRSYRKALPHEVALSELTENAGSQFDPRVVEAVIEVVDTPTTAVELPRPVELASHAQGQAASVAAQLAS